MEVGWRWSNSTILLLPFSTLMDICEQNIQYQNTFDFFGQEIQNCGNSDRGQNDLIHTLQATNSLEYFVCMCNIKKYQGFLKLFVQLLNAKGKNRQDSLIFAYLLKWSISHVIKTAWSLQSCFPLRILTLEFIFTPYRGYHK